MQYLKLKGLSKRYGDKLLFENIDLVINQGEKVALVAANGTGKSSLIRALAGIEPADAGEIEWANGVRCEFLLQEPELDDSLTVLENVLYADNRASRAVLRYEQCLAHPEDSDALAQASREMDAADAWNYEQRVKETLFRLNLTDVERTIKGMSGGEKKRIALAKVLVNDPDFLILDEPTNHLDLPMIEWLEAFLSATNLTLLLITHDRYFLENVCQRIVELERGGLHSYSGNYSKYLEQKEANELNRESQVEKARNLMRTEIEWIRRMPKARGTKNKARIEAFHELKKKASQQVGQKEVTIYTKPERLGSKILELHNVSKSFGERTLFEKINYKFKRFDKVGLVGKNGSGKSTLIQILTEQMPPDTGKVVVGETVHFGIYRQEGMHFSKDKRVIDAVRDIGDYIPLKGGYKLSAEQLLERFLFPRSMHRMVIRKLSGGEQRRLYLLTILMQNPNFLILDEPTNDLDIATLHILEDFLLHFDGCILVVSHDRFFMDKIVDHLFVLEGNGLMRDFPGNYSQWRSAQEEAETKAKDERKEAKPKGEKASYEQRKQLRSLENSVAKLEQKKADIMTEMAEHANDFEALAKLNKKLDEVSEELEEKTLAWMELADQID